MLVSYKWLSEYLDLTKISPKELADQMSLTGIEVEGIEVPAEGLKKIVVGHVVECVDHPDSDHLHICQVNIGEEDLSQIVCGAPNVAAGMNVIVALPGSRIAGNTKIKKGKMRGVVSNGMICSLEELGYSDAIVPKEYSDGIYVLPTDAIPGDEVFSYLDMDDSVIELSITPNRADALSMRGVAYEVGAIYRQKPTFNELEMTTAEKNVSEFISVEIEDEKDCPIYQIRMIEDVKIQPSPQWLQNRLMNSGIRPINNVVDVTNYVLLLFGQPLHAFDYRHLDSKEILVRRAKEAEILTTLDGEERKLSSENIVITNGSTPVALAGVMGGADSEITESTTTVALETALFDSLATRRTSKQFNLRSESSARFEKGINLATVSEAGDYAAALIAELSGGKVLSGVASKGELSVEPIKVAITIDRMNHYLGTELVVEEVNEIFEALGFEYEITNGTYTVNVPPRRWDISIEADIIEEVARIYGYNRLPSTLPSGETLAGSLTEDQKLTRRIRTLLEGNGLNEAISYALTTQEKASQFVMRDSQVTRLDWPMTEDRSVLRLNLISGLLDDVAYNLARKNQQLALYEIGNVFYQDADPKKELPLEEKHLAFAISGEWTTRDWLQKTEKVDFYHAKGILDSLFKMLSLEEEIHYIQTSQMAEMHPGRTAEIYLADEKIGFIGQIHPAVAKAYEINETYVAELSLPHLFAHEKQFNYQAITKYPTISRDIAMLVAEEVSHQDVVQAITNAAGKYLKSVTLFDVYHGNSIEEGHKSLAYNLTFENTEATLTDEEVARSMEKVTRILTENLEAVIR